jgi:hypothetical protein
VESTLSPLGILGGGAIATGLAACGLDHLGLDPTDRVRELVRAGRLGRKAKVGFFEYQ